MTHPTDGPERCAWWLEYIEQFKEGEVRKRDASNFKTLDQFLKEQGILEQVTAISNARVAKMVSQLPKQGETYEYKGAVYIIILPTSDGDLIQRNGVWEPCVKYANYPSQGKRFSRALSEFREKFVLVS